MVDHGDFDMQNVRIGLVEMEALLEDRLIVEGKRQAGCIIGTRSLEAARFDFEQVIGAVAIGVAPTADRIALVCRLDILGLVAPIGKDAPKSVVSTR